MSGDQGEGLAHGLVAVHHHQVGGVGRLVVQERVGGEALRLDQPVLPHPLVVEHLRQVALAGVAEDAHHEGVGVVHLPGDFQREMHDQARRPADEQALLPGQPPGHVEGVPVADRLVAVDDVEPERLGDLLVPDPLDLVRVPGHLLTRAPVLGEG